ncbi:MAG: DnaJ C-terminal domain-containing protein [Alphaproteobacteria bacterium]
MDQQRDYYEVLDVPRDADAKVIKDAFRNLALEFHPDRNKEPGAEERFKEIAEAYAILSDPRKRAEYDARGHVGVAGFSPEDLFGGIDFEEIFGGFGFDWGGGGLFDRLFRRRAGPRRGRDVEVHVVVPLEKVLSGGEETVRVGHPIACPACGGSGAKAGTEPRQCADCDGSGRRVKSERKGNVSFQQIATCPTCRGCGTIIDTPCPECHATGESRREESLAVKIPAGIEEGMALRVPGRGLPAPAAGGPPGDLLVVVRSARDPRFERHGADLWCRQDLDLTDAVLGTGLEVATLDGEVSVKVPPGTQPDTVLRLTGKGLPEFGGGRRGDLFLRLRVHLPERLSREQRRLFEQLRQLGGEAGDGKETAP